VNEVPKENELKKIKIDVEFNLLKIQDELLNYKIIEKELSNEEIEEIINNPKEILNFLKFFKLLRKDLEAKKKKILSLRDNWDGEGSVSYNEETLNRSIAFIENISKNYWKKFKLIIPIPDMFPGIDGDIDIDWKIENFELLITIPNNSEEPAGFYGDDYKENKIKGTINQKILDAVIIPWMKIFQ
jgi:hypothetical protein